MKAFLSRKMFKNLAIILTGLLIVISTATPAIDVSAQRAEQPIKVLGPWVQQWADEFSGSGAVNASNWIYDIGTGYGCSSCANWGTGEIETMTNSTANVNQTGGHLAITPLHTGSDPLTGWTSGRIETQRADFQPPAGGAMAIEASIQMPNVSGAAAQGYWPAFWALGAPFRGVYTNWPSVGEIDIMENVNGLDNVYSTLHCGTNPGGPCNETTGLGSGAYPCAGCHTAYHTYRVEFDKSVSPEQLRWYLDGVLFFTLNANAVDATTWANATNHGFFIILNVAIGGGWPGNPTSATASGVPMNVDYVRVYYANAATAATATRTNTPGGSTATFTRTPTRTNTPVASADFTRGVTSLNSTQAQIWFTSNVNSTWVDVHYLVNNAGQQNFRMTKNGNTHTQTVSGLSAGSVITYWFTYEKAGLAYDTGQFTYTHGSSPTATRTNTPVPATNTRTNTPVAGSDFTQSVTSLSSTSSRVTFVSNVSSTFVDIHYTGAPGLGQQNFRMAQSGNTWTQTISGLTSGTVITYWFTYQKNGQAYDTGTYTFTK